MSRIKIVRTCIVAIALTAVVPPSAHAADAPLPADPYAYVRTGHFSPDAAGIDVYFTALRGGASKLWQSDLAYGDVGTYRRFKAGTYVVALRRHGAAAASKSLLTWVADLRPGVAYTAAAIGTRAHIRGMILADTAQPPNPGVGLVRVIQASSQAGDVSVRATKGKVLSTGTAFGSATRYVALPAGRWTVRANSHTKPRLFGTLRVPVRRATLTSMILLDAPGGGLMLRSVLDAAGARIAPHGAVPAGGGGTAPQRSSAGYLALSWAALGCAAAGALLGGRRFARRVYPLRRATS
jgi:hypothetical protein